MGRRRLSRWQKASAVVPVALLVGAWGAAITDTGMSTVSTDHSRTDPGVPEVPTKAFQEPASTQASNHTPTGIDPKAGVKGTMSTLSENGIPSAALLAYKHSQNLLDKADPACHLPWALVAAIGRVESNHGRHGGNTVGADGVSHPGVYGVPLDGSHGTARISDTDDGALDNDAVWDRAVGPMQFLPSTWKIVGVDGNGDKVKNPQDINDAALAAGVYLCAGDGNLSTNAGARQAVMRYNHSGSYADLVLRIAKAYANGDFTRTPNGMTTPTTLTSRTYDQTIPESARKHHQRGDQHASDRGDVAGGTTTAPGTGDEATSGATGSGEDHSGSGSGSDSGAAGDGRDSHDDSGSNSEGNGGPGPTPTDDPTDQVSEAAKDTGQAVHKTAKDATEDVQKTVIDIGKASQICRAELTSQYGRAPGSAVADCAHQIVGKTLANAQATVGGVVAGLRDTVCALVGKVLCKTLGL